ncbi:hypothetical protein DUI87_18554 [Hirundo rustica rustica]|uniref:Acyloxyacyl hydrolase N-terminal domain-containing protein n=1 Tax=Hirundo rustica rustica TaxID=333673 RepID=A0A3M0JX57_HIRRU|nr:hypothetical protein DUI87_18554 [Hirundo rustica rustica]
MADPFENQPRLSLSTCPMKHGISCGITAFEGGAFDNQGCVLVVSVIEQLAQWHNSTVKAAMERLCDYIPEKLQGFCYVLAELYGPHIAELPDNWDAKSDSNCNGIWGVDPKDGIPYEEKFCKGADSKGIVLLGDSAGAHFHIPPEWMTVTQMSAKSFADLPMAFSDELDWPQFSEITGFLNSTIGIGQDYS